MQYLARAPVTDDTYESTGSNSGAGENRERSNSLGKRKLDVSAPGPAYKHNKDDSGLIPPSIENSSRDFVDLDKPGDRTD